jgi:hypothetical protein
LRREAFWRAYASQCRCIPVNSDVRSCRLPAVMDTLSILKQILDSSAQLSTSALAIFGGTVAAIVGTSYRRPRQLRWRLPFLLFVPGWLLLGHSLYLGNAIASRYLAATMVKQSEWMAIAARVNDDYANQQDSLLMALFFFGAWLVVYLLYWVLSEAPNEETK